MDKVVINGFFGKGNCGDEAILQTWYDLLGQKFSIVASIDGYTIATMDLKKKEFYKKIEIINNNSVAFSVDQEVKVFIIGGGGLGLGFGIKQLLHSRLRNKKNYYIGTTVHDEFFDSDSEFISLNKKIFECFEIISVRDKYSQTNLKTIFNIESNQYGDLAIGLQKEEINISTDKKFVTVIIRDYGDNDFKEVELWIEKIKQFSVEKDYDIIFLPFDSSDQKLLNKLGYLNLYPDIFWEPKKVKYIISKSEFCFSIGRFHPLVFSMSEGVTPYYIEISKSKNLENKYNYENRDKSFYLMYENGLKENFLINEDIDNVRFEKSTKIFEISRNLNEQNEEFKQTIIKKIIEEC